MTFPGYVKFWHYRPPYPLVSTQEGIPIHVTERMCPNVTIAVMPEL